MFDFGIIPSILLVVTAVSIYHFVIYPCFISPLSKIPSAHWSAPLSSAWILWIRFSNREVSTIHNAHERLGPIIQLSPHEVSINCVQGGILKVYSGGFEKDDWYANLFENYGIPNMFSTSHSKPHSQRKRMLSNVYSKSYIQSSAAMHQNTKTLLLERFMPKIHSFSEPFEIYSCFSAVTMDFVTAYQFGLGSSANLMGNPEFLKHFLGLYQNRHSYNFYAQELPNVTNYLKKVGLRLIPKWVDTANGEIEDWTLKMCDGAAQHLQLEGLEKGDDFPEVYAQLMYAMERAELKNKESGGQISPKYPRQLTIASEMLDHLAAGFETSSITLTYFVHEISRRPDVEEALRKELRSLDTPLKFHSEQGEIPPPKVLDNLPFLEATLKETLRLRSAIPGPEPRITPSQGCTLGPNDVFVPGNIRISAQAYSLHRNASVFEDPEQWKPERWMTSSDEKLREMNRWFWAFGSGGRMCIGSNLALYQMKYIIAAIYSNWRTVVVDDDGIEQMDIYTAPPESGKLTVKLEEVPW